MKPRARSGKGNARPASQAEVKPAPPPLPPNESAPELSPDLIRRRAFEIFQARGDGPGDPVADWMQAERELRAEPESGASAEAARPADPEIKLRARGDAILHGDE
ncbi:MAG TPA: DUF2934 domain-containing protein [Phycisphaerales bacterium]|nr:DUF2934 domain-containing protein [Phycisphaerales bacterium]